ncbi:MAG: hypothetical protein EBV73_07945 [Rhodocyclales bacterium]|nr:hypothetical protein [Rhodocyclales bacterium]
MAKDKVYTAEMGQPPMDPEVAPRNPKPSKRDMPEQLGEGIVVKKAKGGMTASKRADGIAQRGKTRGTIVMCGGGYMKGK